MELPSDRSSALPICISTLIAPSFLASQLSPLRPPPPSAILRNLLRPLLKIYLSTGIAKSTVITSILTPTMLHRSFAVGANEGEFVGGGAAAEGATAGGVVVGG